VLSQSILLPNNGRNILRCQQHHHGEIGSVSQFCEDLRGDGPLFLVIQFGAADPDIPSSASSAGHKERSPRAGGSVKVSSGLIDPHERPELNLDIY
jgi:hypothetical protein